MCAQRESTRGGRRGFLADGAAMIAGAAAYAAPACLGLFTFFNPWRQKIKTGRSIRVASLESLPVGGPPQRFPVVADRIDAWNVYPSEPIGAVFLRRTGEKEVSALTVVCPHAGCYISLDAKTNTFLCPCHGSKFAEDGKRTDTMAPRDMDSLPVEIRNGSEVWVQYESFQTGTPNKIEKT